MSRRVGAVLALAGLAALLLLEYAAFAGSPVSTTAFDSGIFLRCAGRSALEAKFWGAARPPVVPLVYRLAGRDPEAIRLVQSLVSVAAWVGLGVALARAAPPGLARRLALAAPPLFSLSIPVNQWDGALMSESLFLSLLAGTTALTLELLRAPSLPRLLGWSAVAVAFALSRDSAPYLLAVAAAAVAVRILLPPRNADGRAGGRALLVAALVVLALASAGARASMRAGERWRTPLVNVLLARVLTDPALAETWHERYGLPRNPVLLEQAGRRAWNRVPGGRQLRHELERDPRLADVECWLDERGVRSYERFLLLDEPLRAWRGALEGLRRGVDPRPPVAATAEDPGAYAQGAAVRRWSLLLTGVTYLPVRAPLAVWLAAAALAALLARVPRARPPALLALALLLGALTQAFVTWHGDAAEVDRHVVVAGVLYRLALLAVVLAGLSAVRRPAAT